MKFLMRCLNNGKEEFWHYDNELNLVTKPDGTNPYESIKPKEYATIEPANGEARNFQFKESVLDFYIILGLKCNFHCKYCQQSDVPKDLLEEASPRKVQKLVEDIVNSGIKIEGHIVFWGGEPLVYWKTLKVLIPELRKHFDMRFSLQTNGSLLDDEKYDFLNKYNVDIGISYDGRHTLRDYPVFDDPKVAASTKRALHKRYKISILPSITKDGDDTFEIKRDLTKLFEHDIGVGHYNVVRCTGDDSSYLEYTKIPQERLDQLYNEWYEHFHLPPEQIERGCLGRIDEVRGAIACSVPITGVRSFCPISLGRTICVDMNGNIVRCMNMPLKQFGHISNYRQVKLDGFYHPLFKEKCRKCPYLCACFGTCPLIKDEHSEAFKVNCNNYMPYMKAIIFSAIDSLYGIRVLEFIPEE